MGRKDGKVALVTGAAERLGRLELRVAAAAIPALRASEDTSPEEATRIFEVSRLGPYRGIPGAI